MEENKKKKSFLHRLWGCVTCSLKPALKSCMWLIIILIPVSLAVTLLDFSGILGWIAGFFSPLFKLFGLPGESALVFLTSCFMNIYSAIAVMEMVGISGRAAAILALMCLICHSLFIETAVQKKTGSSISAMIAVRITSAFSGAFILNLLIPAETHISAAVSTAGELVKETFGTVMKNWAINSSVLILKITILVTLLMILQKLLEEFGVIRFLSWVLKHPLRILGLPTETAFLWIVANTLGLTYGSAILIEEVDSGKLSKMHADILNYHIAISHSLLEDTMLFVAVGVSAWWITIPRVVIAGCVVYIRRTVLYYRKKADT